MFTQPFIRAHIEKNIKAPRHWPLCGEFTGTGEFPAQRASNAENVSIWWRHHGVCVIYLLYQREEPPLLVSNPRLHPTLRLKNITCTNSVKPFKKTVDSGWWFISNAVNDTHSPGLTGDRLNIGQHLSKCSEMKHFCQCSLTKQFFMYIKHWKCQLLDRPERWGVLFREINKPTFTLRQGEVIITT